MPLGYSSANLSYKAFLVSCKYLIGFPVLVSVLYELILTNLKIYQFVQAFRV